MLTRLSVDVLCRAIASNRGRRLHCGCCVHSVPATPHGHSEVLDRVVLARS